MQKVEEKPVVKPRTFQVNYIAECEKQMTGKLGRKVKITNGKRKGRFEIEFYGDEDLQNLLDLLQTIGRA